MVSLTGNAIKDTATYTCNSGFELVGTQNVTCQSNAQWSAPSPVCRRLPGMYTIMQLCMHACKRLLVDKTVVITQCMFIKIFSTSNTFVVRCHFI